MPMGILATGYEADISSDSRKAENVTAWITALWDLVLLPRKMPQKTPSNVKA